jgi:hypothetical protein
MEPTMGHPTAYELDRTSNYKNIAYVTMGFGCGWKNA